MKSQRELIEIAYFNNLSVEEARSLMLSYYVDKFGTMDLEKLCKLAGLIIVSCLIIDVLDRCL